MYGGPQVKAGLRASVTWWPDTHSFTTYGPSLTGARPNPLPADSAARTSIGESRGSPRLLMSGANGSLSVSRSVRASTASTAFTGPSWAFATGDFVSGAIARSIEALTAWAVIGVPLWKTAPAFSLNVQTRPSLLIVQESARPGTTRLLKSWAKSGSPTN